MYCDCTNYHAQYCVANAYQISREQVMRLFLLCLCDCHEDEDGKQVAEQEWDEVQAISTRLFRPTPQRMHPIGSTWPQVNGHSISTTYSEETRDSILLLPPAICSEENASFHQQ